MNMMQGPCEDAQAAERAAAPLWFQGGAAVEAGAGAGSAQGGTAGCAGRLTQNAAALTGPKVALQ